MRLVMTETYYDPNIKSRTGSTKIPYNTGMPPASRSAVSYTAKVTPSPTWHHRPLETPTHVVTTPAKRTETEQAPFMTQTTMETADPGASNSDDPYLSHMADNKASEQLDEEALPVQAATLGTAHTQSPVDQPDIVAGTMPPIRQGPEAGDNRYNTVGVFAYERAGGE